MTEADGPASADTNALVSIAFATEEDPVSPVSSGEISALLRMVGNSIRLQKVSVDRNGLLCDVSVIAPGQGSSHAKVVDADRGAPMVWPAPFGRQLTKEEAYIQKLDGSTGASLKLTVLNAEGRVWTMVAGTFTTRSFISSALR